MQKTSDFVKSKYAFEHHEVQWVAQCGITCMIKRQVLILGFFCDVVHILAVLTTDVFLCYTHISYTHSHDSAQHGDCTS